MPSLSGLKMTGWIACLTVRQLFEAVAFFFQQRETFKVTAFTSLLQTSLLVVAQFTRLWWVMRVIYLDAASRRILLFKRKTQNL